MSDLGTTASGVYVDGQNVDKSGVRSLWSALDGELDALENKTQNLDASGDLANATITSSTLTAPVINGNVTGTALGLPAFTFNGTVYPNNQYFSGTIADLGTVTTVDINGGSADGVTIGASDPEEGTFDKVGIGANPTYGIDVQLSGGTAAQTVRIADNTPTQYLGVYNANTGGNAPNAANSTLAVRGMSGTSRAINAGGTVNASGADYAEYMVKADGCGDIVKGQVCGVNAEGKLTDRYDDAVSFVVKSTDPSYVGGDVWGREAGECPVEQPAPNKGESEEDFLARHNEWAALPEVVAWRKRLEECRQKVDRIAFAGQVPCIVKGPVKPGDYIGPAKAKGGGIEAWAVRKPKTAEYLDAVGKVWSVPDEGLPIIAVKVV